MKKQTVIIIVVAVLFVACNVGGCLAGLVAGRIWGGAHARRQDRMLLRERMEQWREQQTPRAQPMPREQPNVAIVALVVGVDEDGPAAEAGIEVGDMILAIDDERLQRDVDLRQLLSAYKPGDRVELTIRSGARTRQVQVTLGAREDSDLPRLGLTYRIIPFARGTD